MSGYESLRWELDDGLLRLTLNRPDRLNAFTVAMGDELVDAWHRASADDAVRAVVLTGAGKAFSAGMDLTTGGNVFGLDESLSPTLGDLRRRPVPPEIERGVRDSGGKVTLAMLACTKPIVAAINGVAVGIGATMTLAADFRIAAAEARIGFVFGRLGITPEACSTWLLPRLVGVQQALEWFYRAEVFSASEARDKGLVRDVVPATALIDAAGGFARSLVADRSAVSVALIRQMTLFNSALPDPRQAHEIESLAMFATSLADGREGVAAFLDKRPARFAAKASEMPAFFPWREE